MRVIVANHSSYPRVGDSAESQRVRRAYARLETGEISRDDYDAVVRGYVAEIVGEQEAAGCDVVTDGQIGWYDVVAHPTRALDGVRPGGLHRFFDTNYLVRRPVAGSRPAGRFGLTGAWAEASSAARVPVMPVLTGAYTLARYSLSEIGVEALTMAYAEIAAEEVRSLKAAGATLVQIEEPSLLAHPEDAWLVSRALALADALPVHLVTYFGDAAPLWRTMLGMPVASLGIDLVYGPSLAATIAADGCDRPLALGVLDGRNTRIEGKDVKRTVDTVAAAVRADEIWLTTSCGLEYLPRDSAVRKLQRLKELAA